MNPSNEPPPLPPVSNSSSLPSAPPSTRQGPRELWAGLLSITLISSTLDGVLSTLDDSVILTGLPNPVSGLRIAVGLLAAACLLALYLGTAVSPLIPLRYTIPLLLLYPANFAGSILVLIYRPASLAWWSLAASVAHGVLGLALLHFKRDGQPWTWKLFKPEELKGPSFQWQRLARFVALHLLLIAPGAVAILAGLAASAVNHYTDGFAQLRPTGLTMHAVSYVSPSGKTVQLIPMIHIGDESFYKQVGGSFPSNAIILLEGVTDTNNLLRSSISYKRAANSLGLSEQRDNFEAARGESRHADVDVSVFTPSTIELLNMVGVLHSGKPTVDDLVKIGAKGQDFKLVQSLYNDLLEKRNEYVLFSIQKGLADGDYVVVPWGAAHMPGISRSLLKQGYREISRRSFTAIGFGGSTTKATLPPGDIPAGQTQ